MGTRCGYREASGPEGHLAHLREFKTNSMEGMQGRYALRGQMSLATEDQYVTDAAERGGIVYTVLSYTTPIGWVCGNGTVRVPNDHYSVTTSKQQGYVRAWLGRKGTVAEFDYGQGDIMRIIDLDRTVVRL